MLKKLGIFLIVASMCLTLGYGQRAQASVAVAPGGIGDLLLFPIYDVTETTERVGIPWENYFVIQNTSDNWVACHLRFRAGTKSIEVYDHILLLSPYDVFFADMMRTSGGGVTITSSDTETLRNSGLINADETTWNAQFSTNLLEDCGYTDDLLTETERGYIEVIGLWRLVGNTKSDITKVVKDVYKDPNDPGATNVYDMLYEMWGGKETGDNSYTPTVGALGDSGGDIADSTVEDCDDVLTGSMEMGDAVTGMYQLENFVALSSFRTDGVTTEHRDGLAGGEIVFPVALLLNGIQRCYTVNDIAWYLNPDYATTVGPTLRDGDNLVTIADETSVDKVYTGFNLMWSLDEVEGALKKSSIWSYYLNDAFGAEIDTDVVLTIPTKHNHFMFDKADLDVSGDTDCEWTCWVTDPAGVDWSSAYEYWWRIEDLRLRVAPRYEVIKNGPIVVDGKIWDTDEIYVELSPGPSPGYFNEPYLKHEVNVVRVGDVGDILFTEFEHGQFRIRDWFLVFGDRGESDAYSDATCYLPIIGLTIRTHHVSGAAAWRSSMTRLQYTK